MTITIVNHNNHNNSFSFIAVSYDVESKALEWI
jgi:hypothetical protein